MDVGQQTENGAQMDEEVRRVEEPTQPISQEEEALISRLRAYVAYVRWYCRACEVWGERKVCWMCGSAETEGKVVPFCLDGTMTLRRL